MTNGSRVSRGDRNRNARLARLHQLVRLKHAVAGIDLADDKQMVVVGGHDSRVPASSDRYVTAEDRCTSYVPAWRG